MTLGIYHEVSRRLHDGVMLRISSVEAMPSHVHVSIMSPMGWPMYTGMLSIIDALGEIPYQLDRARSLEAEHQSSLRTTDKTE